MFMALPLRWQMGEEACPPALALCWNLMMQGASPGLKLAWILRTQTHTHTDTFNLLPPERQ